jgi:hypothetical protein
MLGKKIWTWECHICLQTYPLAVTRRCLLDGHRFCLNQHLKGGPTCLENSFGNTREPYVGDIMGRNCWEYCQYPLQCKVGHDVDVWDYLDLDDYINEPVKQMS